MATSIDSRFFISQDSVLPSFAEEGASALLFDSCTDGGTRSATCPRGDWASTAADKLTMSTHVSHPPILVPLRYRSQIFPDGHIPAISEVPAHLDVTGLKTSGPCSYHTEYASKTRQFNSPLLDGLENLASSHCKGVPELWTSTDWALEMAEFVFRLAVGKEPPAIIEIHPPFVSTVPTIEAFLAAYEVFENAVLARFPACCFVVENRSGTKHPHDFLITSADSILALGRSLACRDLKLGIALDLPQMFTQHFGSKHPVGHEGVELVESLRPIREQIHTLHIWGRGDSGGAHSGGLEGLFDARSAGKEAVLAVLADMFGDGCERHLVVEVTRDSDLRSIVEDLSAAGFFIRMGVDGVGRN